MLAIGRLAAADSDAEPWARGVSDDRKAEAQRLLEQGNTQFVSHDYKAAIATYRQAIAAWDHPAIRFNVVRCLVQLDRPIEAQEQLELALAYGAAPLEEAVYNEALAYQKLLGKQIGKVAISCTQAGVAVTLDGKPLGQCPLSVERRVEPGAHQVVGRLAGFQTRTKDLVVIGGHRDRVDLSLTSEISVTLVHRWQTWVPWVVFGTGFGIAAIGGVLDLKAVSDMSTYDRGISLGCMGLACDPDNPAVDDGLRVKAERESAIAIGIMSVGVATIATGAVMLYLNRGHPVEEHPVIMAGPGQALLGIGGRF